MIIGNTPYVVSKYALGQNADGISNIKIVGDETNGYYIGFVSQKDKNKVVTLEEVTDEIMKNLKENGNVLKDYISEDEKKQKEILKKLIKADIYTRYPKFSDDKNKLQGCVKIVRNDENKTKLVYKPYEEFQQLINNTDTNIMNYYSLNDAGELVVATKTETKFNDTDSVIVTINESSPVDFTTNLNKYALSFDYLWALLVETGDIEFVENIIDLVLKSDIEITIFEEETVTTTYSREEHTEQDIDRKKANFYAHFKNGGSISSGSGEVTVINEPALKSFTSKKCVINTNQVGIITKANTWILDYEKKYMIKEENQGVNDFPSSEQLSSNGTKDYTEDINQDFEVYIDTDGSWYNQAFNNFKKEHPIGKSAGYEIVGYEAETLKKTQRKYYNFVSGQNIYTTTKKYVEESNKTIEKTDRDSKTDNFVTYLVKSKKALDELKITDDWFYEMIEGNERTEAMIDVTKYLMYKATGKDYGVKEYSFSEYDPNKFSEVTGLTGGSIQEKVWWALKDVGFSNLQIAAAMGNIQCESEFNPEEIEIGYNENNGGIGLCQWTNVDRGKEGNNTYLKAYANSKETTWQDENTQIEFLITYLTGNGIATNYVSKSNMGRPYFGTFYNSTAWETYQETGDTDKDIDYLTRAFLANYEGPGEEYANKSIGKRIAYAKKYYNEFKGKTRPTGNSEIVKVALQQVGNIRRTTLL